MCWHRLYQCCFCFNLQTGVKLIAFLHLVAYIVIMGLAKVISKRKLWSNKVNGTNESYIEDVNMTLDVEEDQDGQEPLLGIEITIYVIFGIGKLMKKLCK